MVERDQQAAYPVFFQKRLEILESTQNRKALETFADFQAIIINKTYGLHIQFLIVQYLTQQQFTAATRPVNKRFFACQGFALNRIEKNPKRPSRSHKK